MTWSSNIIFAVQASSRALCWIYLVNDIQLVFLIMIVSSPTRENLSSFFNVYETGYYDLWRNYCV